MNLRLGLLFTLVPLACVGTPDDVPKDNAPDMHKLATVTSSCFAVESSIAASDELHVVRLGASLTSCADHSVRARCPISTVDLSRADLQPTDEAFARDKIQSGSAFVFGKLVADEQEKTGRLVATKVFVRSTTTPTLERERLTTDTPVVVLRGRRDTCGAPNASCLWLTAEPVDGGTSTHLADLDVSLVHLDSHAADESLDRGGLVVQGRAIGSTFVVSAVYDTLRGSGSLTPLALP